MADQEKKQDIPIRLVQDHLKNEYGTTLLAYYDMKKPSTLPDSVLLLNKSLPKVCLHLVQPMDLPRLSAMQGINHINVMRIEALEEIFIGDQNVKVLALFLDHHNGPLGVHLDSLQLHDNNGVVPSDGLRDIIRQIICGLEELRINGFYHGDLSINNIYFSKRGKLLIKLFNFRTKGISKEVAQLEDWVALGMILQNISNRLKSVNPLLTCSLIDDLASTLLGLTDIASLQTVKEMSLQKIFFWEPRRRRIFWIHDVPKALENNASDQLIEGHDWVLPWSLHTHQGLLEEMNAYRKEEEERKTNAKVTNDNYKYKDNDPVQYVRCISGAYTHEDKLKGKIFDSLGCAISVDEAVQKEDPGLFFVLFKLLKDAGIIQD